MDPQTARADYHNVNPLKRTDRDDLNPGRLRKDTYAKEENCEEEQQEL